MSVGKSKIHFRARSQFCIFTAASCPSNAEVPLTWSRLVELILKEDLRQSSGVSTNVPVRVCSVLGPAWKLIS